MKSVLLRAAVVLVALAWGGACRASDLTKFPVKWASIKQEHKGSIFPQTMTAIQYLLRAHGCYRGRPTDRFDAQTVTAVKLFQRRNKLVADGVLGPQTLQRLIVPLRRGARGDAVRAAQILVRQVAGHNGETPNDNLYVDGVFGEQTQEAVKTAQGCLNIPEEQVRETGIVDRRTWCLLLGGDVVTPKGYYD